MEKKRYERKSQPLLKLIDKIKLWPSRKGILHGIKTVEQRGELLLITTHCGENFTVKNSRHSRSDRWLRNRYALNTCKKCKVPEWKLAKYSATVFK